jgi:hypothetical protein
MDNALEAFHLKAMLAVQNELESILSFGVF